MGKFYLQDAMSVPTKITLGTEIALHVLHIQRLVFQEAHLEKTVIVKQAISVILEATYLANVRLFCNCSTFY